MELKVSEVKIEDIEVTDIPKFKMGNVYDSGLFTSKKFNEIQGKLKKFSKFESPKCSSCFNNKICSGCLGFNYFNNSDIEIPSEEECEMQRKLTEHVLIELSDLANTEGECSIYKYNKLAWI